MKNPFIIPSIIIAAAILGGFWMLKPPSEPQEVVVVQVPDISINDAAKEGNTEAVYQHLAAGTDVDLKDRFGDTTLHNAAWNGHKEVAELLIEKAADVNALGDNGTPLDWAIFRKHPETVELLRKHGGKTGEELEAEGK